MKLAVRRLACAIAPRSALALLLGALSAWRHRRRRARKRARMLRDADFVVVSRSKSGRTWLRAMLSHLYHQRYGIPERELLGFDNFHRLEPAVPRILFTHDQSTDPWNRRPRPGKEPFQDKRVLLLVRDPRDQIVSMAFQRARRPGARDRLKPIQAVGDRWIADFLLGDGRLASQVASMNNWMQRLQRLPGSTLVRYEDLRADPKNELRRIAEFFGSGFSDRQIARAVEFASFENLRTKEAQGFFASERLRPRDASDPESFKVRRGVVGGWRDHVSPAEAARLDSFVAANLDPAYGYSAVEPAIAVAPLSLTDR